MKNVIKFTIGLLALTVFMGCIIEKEPVTVEPEPGIITGRALYSGESSHEGIHITVEAIDDAENKGIAKNITARATTEDNGNFYIDGLEAGNYTVYASSPDSVEKAVAVDVFVANGKTVSAGDLQLSPTGSITGTVVVNGTNTGNLGCTVFIAGTSYVAMTDETGKFTLSQVPAGTDYILVVMKGTKQLTTQNTTVTAGDETAVGTINVTVTSGGSGTGETSTGTTYDFKNTALNDLVENLVAFADKNFEMNITRDGESRVTAFDVISKNSTTAIACTVSYNSFGNLSRLVIDLKGIIPFLITNTFTFDFSYYVGGNMAYQLHSAEKISGSSSVIANGDIIVDTAKGEYNILGAIVEYPLELLLEYDATKGEFSGNGSFAWYDDFVFGAYYNNSYQLIAFTHMIGVYKKEFIINFDAYWEGFRTFDGDEEFVKHIEYEYNADDLIIRNNEFDENGNLTAFEVFIFDENGTRTGSTKYTATDTIIYSATYVNGEEKVREYPNADGTLAKKEEFNHNSRPYLKRTEYDYLDGALDTYTITEYDYSWSTDYEATKYDANGTKLALEKLYSGTHTLTEYYPNGYTQKNKTYYYYTDGVLSSYSVATYDENGGYIESIKYDAEGNVIN